MTPVAPVTPVTPVTPVAPVTPPTPMNDVPYGGTLTVVRQMTTNGIIRSNRQLDWVPGRLGTINNNFKDVLGELNVNVIGSGINLGSYELVNGLNDDKKQ